LLKGIWCFKKNRSSLLRDLNAIMQNLRVFSPHKLVL